MIDHVFSDAIGALRDSLESARLERQSAEESFYTDLLTGSTTWRASYSLPGEGMPHRMHCDLALEWSTLSQTSYRQWCQEGELIDPMEILVVIVLRFQRLAEQPDPQLFVDNLPSELSRDSSEEFGNSIISEILPYLMDKDDGRIERATTASNGKFFSKFSYLNNFIN